MDPKDKNKAANGDSSADEQNVSEKEAGNETENTEEVAGDDENESESKDSEED